MINIGIGGRNLTRRNKHPINNTGKGYIYLRASSGMNDNLTQLSKCTEYALKHNREIIFESPTYAASNLDNVFDFSKFPVRIHTNYKEMRHKLRNNPIEPPYYGRLGHPPQFKTFKNHKFVNAQNRPFEFDFSKSYPTNTVLVYASGGGGNISDNILKNIRLRPEVIEEYNNKMIEYRIPEEYISIHLRATDKELNIKNITGINLNDYDDIVKVPSSGNTHADSLKKIDNFINAHNLPVFISGDNPRLIEKLQKQYPQILDSSAANTNPSCKTNRKCNRLHKQGSKDPENLKNAIVDLLILSGAKAIMTSAGGYSRLAKKLLSNPDIRAGLLS
jgi:hypothetical protein